MKTSRNSHSSEALRVEMLKFDASFIYGSAVVIIDFGPDDPEEEREAFDLLRIQNLTPAEAMEVLGVSASTLQRRLKRGVLLLTEKLNDLEPSFAPPKGE